MIGREQIRALIPHAGRMCLIDRVLRWNEGEILCESDNHRDPAHPLRRAGGLSAVSLIEYGAQAAAIHSALLGSDPELGSDPSKADPGKAKRAGMLVSVRNCELHVTRLHELAGPLNVLARRELTRPEGLIYAFEASSAGGPLAEGRITILLAAPVGTPTAHEP
jgi:predicted hotdog family 3-hydroxylacyl-ACP dehydratase